MNLLTAPFPLSVYASSDGRLVASCSPFFPVFARWWVCDKVFETDVCLSFFFFPPSPIFAESFFLSRGASPKPKFFQIGRRLFAVLLPFSRTSSAATSIIASVFLGIRPPTDVTPTVRDPFFFSHFSPSAFLTEFVERPSDDGPLPGSPL